MRSGTGLDKAMTPAPSSEWLETNGLGDYATSTAAGLNTRRYHGLLVANVESLDRHVLLSTLEDWLVVKYVALPLSARCHPGTVYPAGDQNVVRFEAAPCPTFVYRVGGFEVKRKIALLHKRHTVLVRYEIAALDKGLKNESVTLRISPLLAYRSHHALTRANMDLHVKTFPADSGFKIQPYDSLPPLHVQTEGLFDFLPSPEWIYEVEYPVERERGFDCAEDLFSPGLFEIHAMAGDTFVLAASTQELDLSQKSLRALWDEEMARREKLWANPVLKKSASQLLPFMASQMEDFLLSARGSRNLILAGFPWFGSWGRDTLIALPGATFLSGRVDEAFEILKTLAEEAQDGVIPNTFDGDGRPRGWNSVDASLWYAWDCQLFLEFLTRSRDTERAAAFLELCAPAILKIIEAYRAGRVPFVRQASTGLLECGTPQTQLTWMDAQVDGKPVTPRYGYPVEIEALWFNTLSFGHTLAKKLGAPDPCTSRELKAMAAQFAAKFVLPDGTLCDVWRAREDGGLDASMRPNQLLAISLPKPIAPKECWEPVVRAVSDKLLTSFGLRTLSPDDPAFRPTYGGGIAERDGAYHQGTVWPWLIGPYTEALLKACENSEEADKDAKSGARTDPKQGAKKAQHRAKNVKNLLKILTPLVTTHLKEAGIGHISEVFSATAPWQPGGTIAQAWSEAEVYRALLLLKKADPESFEAWEKGLKLFAAKS